MQTPEVWSPDSWRHKAVRQSPPYSDKDSLAHSVAGLRTMPGLVVSGEIEQLKRDIAAAGTGQSFVLQGGDCVERFADCREDTIENKLKIMLQMSVILTYAARKPVVKIGRIAGQYFKPRSSDTEVVDGVELPVYRGDGINDVSPDPAAREAQPARLVDSYFHAAATLNHIRAMIAGGFADLHNPFNWNLHSIERTPQWSEYRDIVDHIIDAVSFMESFGGLRSESVGNVDFYTSHEGLHLDYEEAMTRVGGPGRRTDFLSDGRPYNLGAHMLWVGERTRQIDGAHVEYFRGIANPVGVKLGPDADPEDVRDIVKTLNHSGEPGRLTLITRLGTGRARCVIPEFVQAAEAAGKPVTWCCDPMHGNTIVTDRGVKYRRFDDILTELNETFAAHAASGTVLGGIHFELTGDDVTECTGGALRLGETDLDRNYQSFCDPRLNYNQAMELSFLIAGRLKRSGRRYGS